MDSHVVLEACKEYEHAKEVEGNGKFNGVFTQALIQAFKLADWTDKPMSYYRLSEVLALNATQHPVIAGKHIASQLWFQVCAI